MSTKERILDGFALAGDKGLADYQLCAMFAYMPPSTVRGERKRLEREGAIRKIAEEPNARGYACAVYAIKEKTL